MSALRSLNIILRTSRAHLKPVILTSQLEVFRGLYSASSLGLDGFIQQQQRTRNQLSSIQDKFKVKMKEYMDESSKSVVFTEDLKNMVHIAEEEDINIVIKMIKKFNHQNKELRFGNFVFGPVAMRMFHVHNKPNEALECFKSPELEGFFDQLISQQILFDLLYENQRYNDILECIGIIKERQLGVKYPRNSIVLTFAACYKLNTPESLDFASKLWSELNAAGHKPARRAITFLSSLLLNQNKPEFSLEVLSSIINQNYMSVRNLKVLTLCKLNRVEDTIPILKSILQQDQVQTFTRDVVDAVKEHIEKQEDAALKTEFSHLVKIFQEQGHISNQTLDEQITSEIAAAPRFGRMDQNREQNNRQYFRRRPGFSTNQGQRISQHVPLRDME